MTEQNNVQREYTIPENIEGFMQSCLDFGRKKQGGSFKQYMTRGSGFRSDSIDHPVNLGNEKVASIKLTAEVLSDEQFKITAVMSPLIAANPLTEAALQYFNDMDKAIRKKYLAEQPAPITKADPPWDRLAEKARWAPDDWVYFFDCLIPEPKRGIHTSPDFADLSKLTDDFTNNRKAESYIERKYGEYRTHKNSRKKLPLG